VDPEALEDVEVLIQDVVPEVPEAVEVQDQLLLIRGCQNRGCQDRQLPTTLSHSHAGAEEEEEDSVAQFKMSQDFHRGRVAQAPLDFPLAREGDKGAVLLPAQPSTDVLLDNLVDFPDVPWFRCQWLKRNYFII